MTEEKEEAKATPVLPALPAGDGPIFRITGRANSYGQTFRSLWRRDSEDDIWQPVLELNEAETEDADHTFYNIMEAEEARACIVLLGGEGKPVRVPVPREMLSISMAEDCYTLLMQVFGNETLSKLPPRFARGLVTMAEHLSGSPAPQDLAGIILANLGYNSTLAITTAITLLDKVEVKLQGDGAQDHLIRYLAEDLIDEWAGDTKKKVAEQLQRMLECVVKAGGAKEALEGLRNELEQNSKS